MTKKEEREARKLEKLRLEKERMYEMFSFEREYGDHQAICGIDEVGRGPLIGSVVAAAVILPSGFYMSEINDSKKLSEKKREELYPIIMEKAISVGIGVVDSETIDKVNILNATKMAMKMAINNLSVKPEHVLIDAVKLDIDIPYTAIIKGDAKSESIAAASIVAKVYRDNMMKELDKEYPMYDFKSNKGYGTKKHIEAIKKYGVLKEHRKTFKPVCDYVK